MVFKINHRIKYKTYALSKAWICNPWILKENEDEHKKRYIIFKSCSCQWSLFFFLTISLWTYCGDRKINVRYQSFLWQELVMSKWRKIWIYTKNGIFIGKHEIWPKVYRTDKIGQMAFTYILIFFSIPQIIYRQRGIKVHLCPDIYKITQNHFSYFRTLKSTFEKKIQITTDLLLLHI